MLNIKAMGPPDFAASNPPSKLDDPYLDLLKKCLTRYIFPDTYRPMRRPAREKHLIAWMLYPAHAAMLVRKGLKLFRYAEFDSVVRSEGKDWPADAETMIGLRHLDNLHACIETVIRA